jgi:hypothetical protein
MSMTPSRRTIDAMTLDGAAIDGRLLVVRCSLCRTSDTYMAADLIDVFGGSAHPYRVFSRCRHCGKPEWVRYYLRLPNHDDVGHLRVRRPAGVLKTQLWEDQWFG